MIDQLFMQDLARDLAPPLEPVEQPATLLAAGPATSDVGQVTVQGFKGTEPQPEMGVARPIPRNKAQEALGYLGDMLTKAGVQLDKVGIDIPALGRLTLKDLTIGESGRVLEDMSYGFMPVEGAGGFISGTTRIKPDEALELLNIAPAVGALAKAGGKAAVKGVTKAVESTKGLPVGMSIQDVSNVVEDYRGQHTAPMKDSGAPLNDVTGGGSIYPEDIYGPNGVRYYGDGSPMDNSSFAIVRQFKNKPDATVTIYRAIPSELTNAEKLAKLEKDMAAYMKRNKLPEDAFTSDGNKWYDWAYEEKKKLLDAPEEEKRITPKINVGDWVTINRDYAKEHGQSALQGNYKIISKKVKASEIYTNGDSIHEWGYDPKGKENK